jgi:hypothetical protein
MPLGAGHKLGPYELLALIGAGGMGEVYRARDPRLKREVAVKILPTAGAADPERLRRFEQEARAAASLNHPNILAVYDVGSEDGTAYLVSELLHGESLRERVKRGALVPRSIIDVATQVAKALAVAHDRGVVRDGIPVVVNRRNYVSFHDNNGALKLIPIEGGAAFQVKGSEAGDDAMAARSDQPEMLVMKQSAGGLRGYFESTYRRATESRSSRCGCEIKRG